jgi:hypothetical protein
MTLRGLPVSNDRRELLHLGITSVLKTFVHCAGKNFKHFICQSTTGGSR